jgi:hypothetical protein
MQGGRSYATRRTDSSATPQEFSHHVKPQQDCLKEGGPHMLINPEAFCDFGPE